MKRGFTRAAWLIVAALLMIESVLGPIGVGIQLMVAGVSASFDEEPLPTWVWPAALAAILVAALVLFVAGINVSRTDLSVGRRVALVGAAGLNVLVTADASGDARTLATNFDEYRRMGFTTSDLIGDVVVAVVTLVVALACLLRSLTARPSAVGHALH